MHAILKPHFGSALRSGGVVGGAWIDSGITPGLVVVDSNRPRVHFGSAVGLLSQSAAAH
jgi:hypothetical protein